MTNRLALACMDVVLFLLVASPVSDADRNGLTLGPQLTAPSARLPGPLTPAAAARQSPAAVLMAPSCEISVWLARYGLPSAVRVVPSKGLLLTSL